MDTNAPSPRQAPDRQIPTLLDSVSEATSLIDRLMDIPLPDNDQSDAPAWDRAVARRLERQLVEMMQAALREEPQRRRA